MGLQDLFGWFTGGRNPYMTLDHCMVGDTFWIVLTVVLDLAVAVGYLVIAGHWWTNQRRLTPGDPARRALGRMRNIFVFCGLCGYLFIPIKMVWPAWRLYDLILMVLVYSTWRYALDTRNLRVVYDQLRRTDALVEELESERAESRRRARFLDAVSHDLKTPINGVSLQLAVAEALIDQDDPASLREAVETARAEAFAAAGLLEAFLELGALEATPDPSPPEPFALDGLLDELADRFGRLARARGLEFLQSREAPGLMLKADRSRLERTLGYLLHNAVRFTPGGAVTLAAARDGGEVVLDVSDTGIGIDPSHQPRVFEEFYQVDNRERDRTKGHGLGLPLARRLVDGLGGRIELNSRPGRGSRFRVRLPGRLVVGGTPEPINGSGNLDLRAPLAGGAAAGPDR